MSLITRKIARVLALIAMLVPAAVAAQDPAGSGPINNAANWVLGIMTGSLATAVAVMAVAACGFMMLTGRMNWRFGASVILGCFVIFGAAQIVAGIQGAAG